MSWPPYAPSLVLCTYALSLPLLGRSPRALWLVALALAAGLQSWALLARYRAHRGAAPRRRSTDGWRGFAHKRYRDVWLGVISITVGVALISAQHAIDQIQHSRIAACQAQNRRHQHTVATLGRELSAFERGVSPARRRMIEASRASTVALIDQLAPIMNCTAVVKARRPRPPQLARAPAPGRK